MIRCIIVASLIAVSTAQAELSWTDAVQSFRKEPSDKSAEAHFAFKNNGKADVVIERVVTSCGCTVARVEKTNYKPGESGEIKTVFTFGDRVGPQKKLIIVSLSDGTTQQLELNVVIEEAVTVKPYLVFWRVGTTSDAKTVEFKTLRDRLVNIKSVRSDSPSIKAELSTVEVGKDYVIKLTPLNTNERVSSTVLVQTDYPAENPKTYTIYVRVK